jgi:peptide methionine sulfoxide reductase MsrA
MAHHSHRFVESYDGLVGYGLDRETNENTLIYYLQKFSDDQLMNILKTRMSDREMDELFEQLSALLHKHLSEEEYHQLFLKQAR